MPQLLPPPPQIQIEESTPIESPPKVVEILPPILINKQSVSRSNSTEFESQSRSPPSRSLSPSNGASKSKSPASNISIKSESVIKEVPMSGDRNRFSRSRSPKSRWHHASPTPDPELQVKVITEESTTTTTTQTVVKDDDADEEEVKTELKPVESTTTKVEDSTTIADDMPKVQRKRRWFTPSTDPLKTISSNNSVAISSDSLKTYLPEAKIPKTIDNDVLSTPNTVISDENQNIRKVIKADQNDEKYVQRQPSRTVIIEVIIISLPIFNII